MKQLLPLLLILTGQCTFAAGKALHVVLIVWDGMRPDFVSAQTTPNLFKLAREGVTFSRHHPVYPSMTEVNATALATGVFPWQSGLIANVEFRPAYDEFKPIETFAPEAIRRGDELTDGHYLEYPTVAEILHEHGLRTAIAGSKPVALLLDRAPRANDALGVDVFAGDAMPESVAQKLAQALGQFPEAGRDKSKIDRWTTTALTSALWQSNVPPFSTLWLAEPDYSQHRYGPGSKEALAAVKSSDDNLGRVLRVLKRRKAMDSTDIIVVSDHGFSTITNSIDVGKVLAAHGFQAWSRFPQTERKPGDIMVVGIGALACCYVTGHDAGLVARLAHFLQTQPFTGVVFSKIPVDGAFPLADAGIESSNAPDIAISTRWMPDRSQYGVPGLVDSAGGLAPGQGQHGSLSPFDMHNVCVASGPDFPRGVQDLIPSGNIDIAPTILWILGMEPAKKMSGRVLAEALTAPGSSLQIPTPAKHHKEAEWIGDGVIWRQYLDSIDVNGVTYFEQGNGNQTNRLSGL